MRGLEGSSRLVNKMVKELCRTTTRMGFRGSGKHQASSGMYHLRLSEIETT